MRTVWTESAHLHVFNFFGKHLTPLMLWLRLGIRLRLGLEYMAGTCITAKGSFYLISSIIRPIT